MIINEQPKPQHPGRAQALVVWQDEAQRPDDMRRDLPQHFTLLQGLSYQPELVSFEVAQPAMDQLG